MFYLETKQLRPRGRQGRRAPRANLSEPIFPVTHLRGVRVVCRLSPSSHAGWRDLGEAEGGGLALWLYPSLFCGFWVRPLGCKHHAKMKHFVLHGSVARPQVPELCKL